MHYYIFNMCENDMDFVLFNTVLYYAHLCTIPTHHTRTHLFCEKYKRIEYSYTQIHAFMCLKTLNVQHLKKYVEINVK